MTECNIPSVGSICVSLSGHDAGMLFILIGNREDKVLLVDGKKRKFSNPKIKNYKHISILSKLPDNVVTDILNKKIIDSDIVHILKIAKKELLK